MPSLLAVLPLTIGPALRRGAGNYQVEPVAVGIFAGLCFAFDVERFQLSSHMSLRSKPSSEPTVPSYGLRFDCEERRRIKEYSLPAKALILLEIPNGGEHRRTLYWRKGWDSNPRYPCGHAGFQDRCLKPLGHPSKPCNR